MNDISRILERMLIFIISEAKNLGHISISDVHPYYFIENEDADKLNTNQIYKMLIEMLEEILNEKNDEILLVKNQFGYICDVIDMEQVTNIDISEIHHDIHIFEFEISFKKNIVKRISDINDVVNLKQLLEKLGRFDLLIKLY
jgi:hypothetical protein